MKSVKIVRGSATALLVWGFASAAGAYVDIELEGGRHVIGESYSADGQRLTVYRPSGVLELDRSTVRSIQERAGNMGGDMQSSSLPAADGSGAPAPGAHKDTTALSHAVAKDPEAREHELAHSLIDTRLERLAAMQRGDDATIKKLDKEINKLQTERQSNWKKLHPEAGRETSSD